MLEADAARLAVFHCFMLSEAKNIPNPALYCMYRHETDINLLISLAESARLNSLPENAELFLLLVLAVFDENKRQKSADKSKEK